MRWDMYAYLIKVEAGANNNKYYEMIDNEDGTFTAKWGRVGRNP
jgi:predicted DNA-binding WGR domain protein